MLTRATRRVCMTEACIDWLALAAQVALYGLVSAPIWGTVLGLAIVWDRMHF